MTPSQRKTLDFILSYWKDRKTSPSYREIASLTGSAVSNIYRIVDRLANRGFIHVVKGSSRAIYPIHEWQSLTGTKDYNKLINENKRMREALKEIRNVAECSEGVEFYVMLADEGLRED